MIQATREDFLALLKLKWFFLLRSFIYLLDFTFTYAVQVLGDFVGGQVLKSDFLISKELI
jgi:hypothetical protein